MILQVERKHRLDITLQNNDTTPQSYEHALVTHSDHCPCDAGPSARHRVIVVSVCLHILRCARVLVSM